MSSPDGMTLESFVRDGLRWCQDATIEAWIARLEPQRESIEQRIEDWYMADGRGEAPSWRDTRNQMWRDYGDPEQPGSTTRWLSDTLRGLSR